jgi:hypothetical protein
MLTVVDADGTTPNGSLIDEIVRGGCPSDAGRGVGTFATVRLRTKVTRGAGSRTAALAMTFKLIESAQQRWRAVNAPHLVALVRAGTRFDKGVLVEREQVAAA